MKHNLTIENLINNPSWRNQFNILQRDQIQQGVDKHLNVSIYADPKFDWQQMKQLREGLEQSLDVSIYANLNLNHKQMEQVKFALGGKQYGLLANLNLSQYTDPSLSWQDMSRLRSDLLDDPKLSWEDAITKLTQHQPTLLEQFDYNLYTMLTNQNDQFES